MSGKDFEYAITPASVIPDAPPGTYPPPVDKTTELTLPQTLASPPEAIFSERQAALTNNGLRRQFARAIILESHAPIKIDAGVTAILEGIFTAPVTVKPDYPKFRSRRRQRRLSPHSFETAIREYSLESEPEETTVFTRQGSAQLYDGVTIQGDRWLIGTPGKNFKVPTQLESFTLNGAAAELERRQYPFYPGAAEDLQHDKYVMFFAVNWDKLVPIFFDGEVPDETPMRRFVEVNLNHLEVNVPNPRTQKDHTHAGVIDFLGELPDGQLVLVEFRRPGGGKTIQLARHTRGLQEVLRQHNGKHTIPHISQFKGVIEQEEGHSLLKIFPRTEIYEPHMAAPEGETLLYAAAD